MKFLDITGLKTFLTLLKQTFASSSDIDSFVIDTQTYVTEIDYDRDLLFDTTMIVGTSSTLDDGI